MKIIDKLQLPDMMAMFKHEPWANALYLIWAPVIVFCVFLAKWHYHLNVLTILVGIFIGILVWTLLEYLIHRFVFHLKSDSPSIKRIVYRLHGKHHEFPTLKNTFMWPSSTIVFGMTGYLLQMLLQIPAGYREILVAGIALGFLAYETVHYGSHQWKANSFIWRFFKRYHALHHYKEATHNFGVTTSLWDHIFGTYLPDSKNYARKHLTS